MNLPPLILASASPRRIELLREIVPDFGVVTSYAHEVEDASMGARRLCETNAQRKAFLVAERYPAYLVLGADTVVWLDGEPLGKPADGDAARMMLRKLSGRVHEVATGVCLIHQNAARTRIFSDVTHVKFKELHDGTIEEYLARVHTLDKAGGYALQEHGDLIIERTEGSWSNVVGLPLEALGAALTTWNQRAPA
jgi:septum formation protein